MSSQFEGAIPDLAAWHEDLKGNFARIRRDRQGSSVYGLEHGLQGRDLERLTLAVGAAIRRHGAGEWWNDRWLPLIVVATEVGYRYRGTGTDYWPVLEATLNAELGGSARLRLSEFFSLASRSLSFKQPVDTPWTRLFRHIAWPIANAVAPVEIHRALAQSLQRMFVNPPATFEGAVLATALRTSGRLQGSARLNQWLADDTLAVALSRRLLRLEDDGSLSVEIVDRIWADLTADPVARKALTRATREHRLLVKQRRPSPELRQTARFQLLVPERGDPVLLLRPPALDPEVGARARQGLGGTRVPLWASGAPVALDALASERPIAVVLASPPERDDEFLPELETRVADKLLVALLRGMKPEVPDRLVFTGNGDLKDAADAGAWTNSDKFWVIVPPDQQPPAGARRVGSLCGASCFEADAESAASFAGLTGRATVSSNIHLTVESANQIGFGPRGPILYSELPTLFRLRGSAPGEVILARRDGEQVRLSQQHPYIRVDVDAGDHQIELFSEATGEKRAVFGWTQTDVSRRLQTPPVEILLDPADATVNELLRGEVSLLIRAEDPVELPDVAVALVRGEQEIFRGHQLKVRAPAVIGGRSALMRELVDRLGATTHSRGSGLYLVAQAGAAVRQWWSLEAPARPVIWEIHDDRWAAWVGDEELPVVSVDPGHPLKDPEPDTGDGLLLRLPVSEGVKLDEFGLVAGAGVFRMGAAPDVTDAPLRRWSDRGDRSPARILRAYLRWSAAESASFGAEVARRSVSERLQASSVAALCGRDWAKNEKRLRTPPGDLWTAIGEASIDLGLTNAGFDMPLSAINRETLARQLGARLRQVAPDLASRPPDTVASCEQEFDLAVNEAWVDVFDEIWNRERRVIFEDPDAGNSGADWVRAVAEGKNRLEISGLRAQVLPEARSKALASRDYGMTSVAELVRLLDGAHVDLAPRGSARWLHLDDLRRGLMLWINPAQLAEESCWPESVERLLADRQTCRAIRYAALRHLAARRAVMERVDVS